MKFSTGIFLSRLICHCGILVFLVLAPANYCPDEVEFQRLGSPDPKHLKRRRTEGTH